MSSSSTTFSIATFNVNGIRAAFRRGMGEWLTSAAPDVLLLQEVRATDEILQGFLGEGWHLAHEESAAKGRAGVAIASRIPFDGVRLGVGDPATRADGEVGRWVEADIMASHADGGAGTPLTVISTYIHSGTVGTPSMEEKYAFLDKVTARMGELAAQGRAAVVGGDVNIAHTERDIKNWKGNRKSAGFLPEERAYLDQWTAEHGWVDLGRQFAGDVDGPYTWWSWRGKAFDNDSGWRIDYQFASPALAGRATEAMVDRAPAYDQRISDHAPLRVTYS
ncbi:exodeoxyribonuclease III [Ruania halotolerans]|uniref:exodeoxyribonuclease III n=1 Tax=Ruania halotolerans TaxID=2897773 RepID=UPI001E3F140F|nr:exodeoxyribonuclease III [Ruania halotolerans]UFU05620.1 exodeoxyribonuclease III [Ruania halotolerans]